MLIVLTPLPILRLLHQHALIEVVYPEALAMNLNRLLLLIKLTATGLILLQHPSPSSLKLVLTIHLITPHYPPSLQILQLMKRIIILQTHLAPRLAIHPSLPTLASVP